MNMKRSNKVPRLIIVSAIMIVVVLGTVLLVTNKPITHYKAQQIMERQIPEAISFVLEHENELNAIQELQGRLNGIGYLIQQWGGDDVTLHVYTYSPGLVMSGSKQSFAEYTDMSEDEKNTIYEVLSALPVANKSININPEDVTFFSDTYFGFNLFYQNTISLWITDNRNAVNNSSDSKNHYYEQINDNWFLSVWFWQND